MNVLLALLPLYRPKDDIHLLQTLPLRLGQEQDERAPAEDVDRRERHEELPLQVGLHRRCDFGHDEI